MVQSNALSQRPDHGIDESTGREEQTLLPDDMFINLIDIDLQEQILNSSDKMTDIKTTLETIMKEGPTNLQNDLANWKIEDVDGRNKGCRICQQFKINKSPSHPAYQLIEGAKTTCPFANCSMDLITDLPPIKGYDSILVMVDQGLSKGVILCPCAKIITWEGISELLQDNLFKRFGLPDRNISDRDPRFAARAFPELFKLLNITSSLSTAYHPQTDRATKRVNQEIKADLLIYCTTHPEDWLNSLTTMKFTHNNRRHAEQKHTPFKLILGDNPISVPITFQHTKYPNIEEKIK